MSEEKKQQKVERNEIHGLMFDIKNKNEEEYKYYIVDRKIKSEELNNYIIKKYKEYKKSPEWLNAKFKEEEELYDDMIKEPFFSASLTYENLHYQNLRKIIYYEEPRTRYIKKNELIEILYLLNKHFNVTYDYKMLNTYKRNELIELIYDSINGPDKEFILHNLRFINYYDKVDEAFNKYKKNLEYHIDEHLLIEQFKEEIIQEEEDY